MAEYTPDDEQVEAEWTACMSTPDPDNYWDAISEEEAKARWSRWLAAHDARVKRDAAREALSGLVESERDMALIRSAREDHAGFAQCMHAAQVAEARRDIRFPEQED